MVFIQLEIPDEISKELKIYKIQKGIGNQQQAIIFILREKLIEEDNGRRK